MLILRATNQNTANMSPKTYSPASPIKYLAEPLRQENQIGCISKMQTILKHKQGRLHGKLEITNLWEQHCQPQKRKYPERYPTKPSMLLNIFKALSGAITRTMVNAFCKIAKLNKPQTQNKSPTLLTLHPNHG